MADESADKQADLLVTTFTDSRHKCLMYLPPATCRVLANHSTTASVSRHRLDCFIYQLSETESDASSSSISLLLDQMSDLSCSGKSHNCPSHFHDDDPEYWTSKALINASNEPEASRATASERQVTEESKAATSAQTQSNKQDAGLRRVIRNFTPSYVTIS